MGVHEHFQYIAKTPTKTPTLYLAPGVCSGNSEEMSSRHETRLPASICQQTVRETTQQLPRSTVARHTFVFRQHGNNVRTRNRVLTTLL